MLIQSNTTLKLGLFKKAYMFETEHHGIVIENEGDVVCVYGTDYNHQNIYCAIPLCHPKYLRRNLFVIRESKDKVFVDCTLFKIMIDFKTKKCACNDERIKLYGSDHWGEDVSVAWND